MMCISGMPVKRLDMSYKIPAPPGTYYHYTSLETLWDILETETLRATQARFSNDSEEIKKGIDLLKDLCSQCDDGSLEKYVNRFGDGGGEDIDCYIICFCGGDDILSQWRGYCRRDGVSIGFAFDETQPRYYFKNTADTKEEEPQKISLYQVWYVAEEGKKYIDGKTISREVLKKELLEKLKCLDELSPETCKMFADGVVPLIKHAGFCEEDEYRLMIRNVQSEHGGKNPFPLDKYVRYSEADGIKRPYITISFGKNQPDPYVKEVQLYGLKGEGKEELRRIFELPFVDEDKEPTYRLKFVDDWTGSPQIIIGQGKDQQKIFEAFDRVLTANTKEKNCLFSGVKLWCEGHLPIRSIKVSPCQNQKEVIESIQHYCVHQKFWMKYVEVSGSDTPYRRPK